MHIKRLLSTLLIGTALASAACASTAPRSSAPVSGPGWQVVRVEDGVSPYLRVTTISGHELLVSFGVDAGCEHPNEFIPSFAGFEARGDALVALVTRTPLTSAAPCVGIRSRAFDLQLDVGSIPGRARRIILGAQACPPEDSVCNGLSAAIPSPPPVAPSASPR